MIPSSRTPEGQPNDCPVCCAEMHIKPSHPTGDAPCPSCGQLVWFPALAGMDGLDFFVGKGTIYEIAVSTKFDAIYSLVRQLSQLGHVETLAVHSVVNAVIHREDLGSTGIGSGMAIPHAEHATIERMIGIIGRVPNGVDFGSADGTAVNRVFLLLSPPNTPGDHLRALEAISRRLRTYG